MHLVKSLVLLSEVYLYLERYAFAAKSRASVGTTREAEIGCEFQGQNWDYISLMMFAQDCWRRARVKKHN